MKPITRSLLWIVGAVLVTLAIAGNWDRIKAAGTDVNQLLFIARALPTGTLDGAQPVGNVRAGRYREQYVEVPVPNKNTLADEGTYFVANNSTGTPGAGAATGGNTQTAWVATTPTFILQNTAQVNNSNAVRIYVDTASLQVTNAGVAETQFLWAAVRDVGVRYSSGGTTLTISKPNSGGNGSVATAYYGALTATAATAAAQTLAQGSFRPVIPVLGDVYLLQFGSVNNEATSPFSSTVAANLVTGVGPIVLNPNETLLIYTWGASMTTTPQAIPQFTWWER